MEVVAVRARAVICRSLIRWPVKDRSMCWWSRVGFRILSSTGSCRVRRAFLTRLASFARLIQFDRRGAGMSGGIAGATPLEEQIDDVRAVLEAAGSEQPALISIAEGCALAVLFAASHPRLVRALVLIAPTPRVVRGDGYEWAQSVEERGAMVQAVVEYWGSSSPKQPWGAYAGQDEQRRRLLARHRRLSMTPDAAAASLAMVGELDVRDALGSVAMPDVGAAPRERRVHR